jgi:hypothetical protein
MENLIKGNEVAGDLGLRRKFYHSFNICHISALFPPPVDVLIFRSYKAISSLW